MHPMLFLAESDWYILVGFWNPLIALGCLLFWGWLVSSKLDKDARYWHLAINNWNMAHLITGLLGYCLMVAPFPVWWWSIAGIPIGLLVMFSSTCVYWVYRNRQVPEENKYYLSLKFIQDSMQRRAMAKSTKAATITLTDSKGLARVVPQHEDVDFPVHIAMEDLISPALLAGATSVDVVANKNGQYIVNQYVDGIRYKREPIEKTLGSATIDYLKKIAGLDIEDRRRWQRGDFSATMDAEHFELRVRTSGTSTGQNMKLEINLRKRVNRKPENLGLTSKQLKALESAIENRHGIVLVSALPGNGLTTTLYGLIRLHDAFTANIRTLEIEQILQLEGVGHSEFKRNDEMDFSKQLRSILRRDPDIVMISDLVDENTAKEAAHPGVGGPLIYLGIKAESNLDAIVKWVKGVGDLKRASEPLKATVHVRLLRKLCDNCKTAYQPAESQLKKLGLPADQVKKLFRHAGKVIDKNKEIICPVCNGIGYSGTVAAFEVVPFDAATREMVAKSDLNGVKTHMRREQLITLQQAALRRAIEGLTSIEEVMRVIQAKTDTKSSKPKAVTTSTQE